MHAENSTTATQDIDTFTALSNHPVLRLATQVVKGELDFEQAYAALESQEFSAQLTSDDIVLLNEQLFYAAQDLAFRPTDALPTWDFLIAQFNYEAAKRYFPECLPYCALTLGLQLQRLDRYDDAIRFYHEALETLPVSERRWQSRIHTYLGTAYHYKFELSEAITHYEKTIERSGEIGDRSQLSKALGNLGVAYQDMGNLEQARKCYERALTISRELGERWEEARELENIGSIYQHQGHISKALEYFNQALTISVNLNDPRGQASLYNKLGTASINAGKPTEAAEHFKLSIEILTSDVHDPLMLGMLLSNLGAAYRDQGKIGEARQYYQQALDLSRQFEDRRGEADALANIAAAHYASGELEEAVGLSEQALETFRKIGDRLAEARCLGNLAQAYLVMNRAEDAVSLFEHALTIARHFKDPREEAVQLANLANAYYEVGLLSVSAFHFAQAIDISQGIGDLKTEAECWSNLGLIKRAQDDLHQARICYYKGLELSRNIHDRRGMMSDLVNLGVVYLLEDEFHKAQSHFEEALRLSREVGDHRTEAGALVNLGYVSACLKNTTLALSYYDQALDISMRYHYLEHLFRAYYGLGLLFNTTETEKAYHRFKQAIEVLEQMRAGFTEQEFKMGFLGEKDSVFEKMVDLLASMPDEVANKLKVQKSDELFHVLESAKSRVLLEVLGNPRLRLADIDRDDPDVQEERGLNEELEKHFLKLRQKGFFIPPSVKSSAPAQLEFSAPDVDYKTYMETLSQHRLAVNRLRHRHPQWGSLQYVETPGMKEVQALIPEGTVLIEYFVTSSSLVSMVLDRENVRVTRICREEFNRIVGNGAASIQKSLSEHVRHLRDYAAPTEETLKKVLAKHAYPEDLLAGRAADQDFWSISQPLYDCLLRPIEPFLAGMDSLIISAHGILHELPFQLLWDGERYLVERYAISYVPNAGILKFVQIRRNIVQKIPLILADPVGELSSTDERGQPRKPLPMARKEAEDIAKIFGVRAYTAAKATASLLKREARRHHLLHLACHGDFAPENIQFTALLLAPDDLHNGRLTVREIMEDLNLEHADLVVLSACDLGLSRHMPGDDLIGMTRAFMYAGASSVVVSLWRVNDRSAAELMVSFYQKLASGMTKVRALQGAQTKMITEARKAQQILTHKSHKPNEEPLLLEASLKCYPYFWAPFVLVGNPN